MTKYTPNRVTTICEQIAKGMPIYYACAMANITHETYLQWKKTHSEFSEAIKKAEALDIERRVARLDETAKKGNWTADAWMMERRYPEQFGNKQHIEHSGKVEVIQPDPNAMKDEGESHE